MSVKRKILYVVTRGSRGGAQRYVADLARAYAAEWDITIAIGEAHVTDDLLSRCSDCCSSVRLKHLVRRISPLRDIRAVFELRRLYRDLRPDIVHLNSSKAGTVGSLAALCMRGRPRIVYTAHGWVFHEPLGRARRAWYSAVERITASMKDAVITLGKRDGDAACERLRIPRARVHIIPHGIAAPQNPLSRAEARWRLSSLSGAPPEETGTVWAGTIANYLPTKGLDILLDAVSALSAETKKRMRFFLIGEGPMRAGLADRISQGGLDGTVHLVGSVPRAADLLPAFDVFVLPSRKEGLPYALLEALVAGVPVVATRVGSVPEVLEDGKTGILVPPGDADALALALQHAETHPKELAEQAAQARGTARMHSADEMITATERVYRQLLRAE